MIPRCLKAVFHDAALLCSAISQPTTKGQDRDLQTAGSEVTELL
jgi:hypothetical protein